MHIKTSLTICEKINMLNMFKISYILMSHLCLYEDNSFLTCVSYRTYMYMVRTIFVMVNKNVQRPGVISILTIPNQTLTSCLYTLQHI